MARAIRTVTAIWLAGLATAGAAAPAQALSRAQADRVALAALHPGSERGRIVLFGLPAALGARQVVSGLEVKNATGRPLGRRAWLYWEDQSYEAQFVHPSVLLLIDDRSGRVLRRERLGLYPLLDGGTPAFLASAAAYHDPRYQLFNSTVARTARPAKRQPRARAAASFQVGPAAMNGVPASVSAKFANDCLVVVRYTTTLNGRPKVDPKFAGDAAAIEQWAKDVGLKTEESGPTPADLMQTVHDLVAARGGSECKDVFIYFSGHGVPGPTGMLTTDVGVKIPAASVADTGPAGVITGVHVTKKPDGTVTGRVDQIHPDDVLHVIETFDHTTFKVKIDSCYSGRFTDALAKVPRLLVLEHSSAADEVSYSHLSKGPRLNGDGTVSREEVVNGEDNPTDAGEFTNGDVHGLYEWARDPAKQEIPPGHGSSALAWAIEDSFTLGAGDDFAHKMGYTHPGLLTPDATRENPYSWGSLLRQAMDAELAGTFDADTEFFNAFLSAAKGVGASRDAPRGASAAQAEAPVVDGIHVTPAAPAGGRLDTIRLKGHAISGDRQLPDGSIPIRFQVLRPNANGTFTVVTTTDPPFLLPPTDGVWSFSMSAVRYPVRVRTGDYISLAFRGGRLSVFGAAPGSQVNSHVMAGSTQQDPGTVYSPTPNSGEELLLNATADPDPGTRLIDDAIFQVKNAVVFETVSRSESRDQLLRNLKVALGAINRGLVSLDAATQRGDTSSPGGRAALLRAFDRDAEAIGELQRSGLRARVPEGVYRTLQRALKSKNTALILLEAARKVALKRGY